MRRKLAIAPSAAALAVLTGALPQAAAAPGWRWPVRGEVVERFAAGDPYAAGQHRGVDIAAPRGAQVRAACAGRVRFAGRVASFGRAVSVSCGRLVVSYGHLDSIATRRGERVGAGERIGTVGTTGKPSRTPHPHLHLGVRRAEDPHGYVDPLRFLPASRPPSPVPAAPRRPTTRPGPAPLTPPFPATDAAGSAPLTRPFPATDAAGSAPAPAPGRLPAPVLAGLVLLGAAVPGLALFGSRRRRARRRTSPGMPVAFRNSSR